MVELRIERENRIARLYFIQGICVEKRDRIWIADVLLKEVRLRDNTKAVGIKLCARTIEFLTIILLAIFTTEFLNFCTNALIWVNLDRKERENEKHID